MTIPQVLYDSGEIDGATGARRFVHVTFPLLGNLYLVCTLLATIWAIGDFNTVYFVSGGGPGMSTDVLTTLGFRYAFGGVKPELGTAAMLSALPVLIPIVIILIRRCRRGRCNYERSPVPVASRAGAARRRMVFIEAAR
jgi:multiple sugar transport system permease protein